VKQFNFDKGRLGEDMARKYLEEKGYVLVEANHRNYLGEIDLVMTKQKIPDRVRNDAGLKLVFVEVKLKIGQYWGTPEEMLSKSKLARVERVANAFLVLNPKYKDYVTRLEAVCIVLNEDQTVNRISHYDQF
jgi:putative endonuclease